MDRRSADGARRLASAAALLVLLLAAPTRAQTTTRVSVASGGAQAHGQSRHTAISAAGRYVAFTSAAADLVPGDTNGWTDIFVHDLQTGATERVSVDSGGLQGDGPSEFPSISADGRYVAFESLATNLVAGDTNSNSDVFVRDRLAGTTERVSVDSGGVQGDFASQSAALSADGRYVAFHSRASSLVAGDTNAANDVFVHDRQSGTTERVSIAWDGSQADGPSESPSISSDGRDVAFHAYTTNLVVGDTNLGYDVFVRDRQLGTIERVSVDSSGVQANGSSTNASISADGQHVAFTSNTSNLVPGDTNIYTDIFVRDRQAGTTERASVSSAGGEGDSESDYPSISADGQHVSFHSFSSNLVALDTNGVDDVFVRNLQSGTTERVSVTASGAQGSTRSYHFTSITAHGDYVAFSSDATNLVAGDTNASEDVFVRNRRPSLAVFCFGDGIDGTHTTPCPCGNSGAPGHGCAHSFDANGAQLTGSGTVLQDDLELASSSEPASSFTLFLQHDAAGDFVFHDGVLCAGGMLVRLRGRSAVGGAASFPNPLWDSSITLSQRGGVFPGQGVRRYYSAWYRNASTSFCPPATANVTNGVYVDW